MPTVRVPSRILAPRTFTAFRPVAVAMAFVAAFLLGPARAEAQSSCTGLCLQQVACTGGKTTSITGTVYAPNGTDPLPNVLVYIPNAPVGAFPAGVSCNPNGQPALGSPLVSTTTAYNGTFTLTNVPVGANIPLVVQAGKWRRQFVVPTVNSCANTAATTAVPAGQVIRLPKNKSEGDIPLIAIATGNVDAVECVLSKMGVDNAEFTNPGGGGRINLYLGYETAGSKINASTPVETVLEDNLSLMTQYDLIMLPCQGNPYTPDPTALANMVSYANAGGRVYATHYSYDFLYNNPPFSTTATWAPLQTGPSDQNATINQTFPDGAEFAQWLHVVDPAGTLGVVPVTTIRKDQNGINPATSQAYLSIATPGEVVQFTFSTPVGAPVASQCGRVLYNEYHVEAVVSNGTTFPAECPAGAITPQEQFLEYSLFDLGTYSSPQGTPTASLSFTPTPAVLIQGDAADSAVVNVTNTSATTAANTTLSLALTLSPGLTATALGPQAPGSGWTCNVATLTCTRSGAGLDAGASDAVVVTYAVAGNATSPQSVGATVANGNLAAPVTGSVPLPVRLVPMINWPTPAAITYGTPLSATQLDATASYNSVPVAGTFVYAPTLNTVLDAGLQTLSVQFTPNDLTDYAPASQIVGLQVNSAPQAILFTPVPASPDIAGNTVVLSATGGASGNPVVFSVLSGPAALAADGVTLTYTGAGTVVVAADQAGSAQGDYAAAPEVTATINVNPAAAAYNAGTVPVASQSGHLVATLNLPNGGTLASLNYLTQGAPNLDFLVCDATTTTITKNPGQSATVTYTCPVTINAKYSPVPKCSVGSTYAAGAICTVDYVFKPHYPGQRLGAIEAVDNNGAPMGTSYVSGLGTGPQVVFPGNTAATILTSSLSYPEGIAVDGVGNIFVTDTFSNVVKEIPYSGGSYGTPISLGSGYSYPEGDAVDGAGNVYVVDAGNQVVKKIPYSGGSYGPTVVVVSGLGSPEGVAVDGAGNVYIADPGFNEVMKVPYNGGGYGPKVILGSGFSNPQGLAVDGAGNVYVGDLGSNSVKEIPSTGGSYGTPVTLATNFSQPRYVAVDAAGNVYVTDSLNNAVKEIPYVGGSYVTPVTLGSGFSQPQGLALDGAGNLYVADVGNAAVKEIPLATPPSVNFADTNVGQTSSDSPQSVLVANNGYDPTNINPLTFSGVAAPSTTNFALDAAKNTCSTSTSLEPGHACVLAADFVPQTSGSPLTDAVTLADNNLNNITPAAGTQSVALSGNGLQQTPVVTVAPASIVYGTAMAGLSATVGFAGSIAPTGAVTFSIDGGAPVLAACSGSASPLTCTATYPSGALAPPSHSITASIAATPGFLASSGSNTLTVTPATPSITVFAPASFTYGTATVNLMASLSWPGQAQPTGTFTFAIDGYISVPGVCTAGGSCTATYNSAGLAAGNHSLSASITADVNYNAQTSSAVPFHVSQAPLTVTAGSYAGSYDGAKHALSACTVSANFDNLTCTNSPVGPVGPDVGGGAVNPLIAGPTSNYNVTIFSGSWVIFAKPVSVTAGGYSGTFDGSSHATSACISSYAGVTCTNSLNSVGPGAGSGNVSPVVSYATGTAADYSLTQINGSWSIARAGSMTTISCPVSVVYNGTAQTPCTASVTGVGGLSQSVPVTYGSNTIAGTAVASANFTGDANHTSSGATTNFAITKAPLTLTAGSYTGVYDGSSHALPACVASANYDGITCSNSVPGPVGPDVGGAVVVPAIIGSASNYAVTANNGSWSITPRAVTLTAGSYSGTYNGAAHAPSACSSNYAGVTCTNNPASVGPGAGTGAVNPVAVYGAGKAADYTVTAAAGSYNIAKLAATITPNAATKVYGAADPALTGTATGFLAADHIVVTYSRTAGEAVSGSPYAISGAVAANAALANYSVASNTAPFTITKATTTTTIAVTTTQTYTGTTATITATVHPQITGTPTGTVTYYNGSTALGSAAVGTAFTTPVLPVGSDQLSAVYGGDANFLTSTSASSTVTSIAPTNIILIPALTHALYPLSSVAYTVIVPLKLFQIVSGTVTVYDGTTLIGTFPVLPLGIVVGITPQLGVGTHNLVAYYSGNGQYPPGASPIETVTVTKF